jgi:hypothetical protein
MENLFEAYIRAGFLKGGEALPGSIVRLDLPTETQTRYYFIAQFTKNSGWQVHAKIRPEHLDIQFASVAGP